MFKIRLCIFKSTGHLLWRAIPVGFCSKYVDTVYVFSQHKALLVSHAAVDKPRVLVPVAITHQPRVSNLAKICTLFPPSVFFPSMSHFAS